MENTQENSASQNPTPADDKARQAADAGNVNAGNSNAAQQPAEAADASAAPATADANEAEAALAEAPDSTVALEAFCRWSM